MHIELPDQPDSAVARLSLLPGDSVTARAGTLLAMSPHMKVSTVDCLRPTDDAPRSVGKIIAGDRFICNRFECLGQPADLWLGNDVPGDLLCLNFERQSLIVNRRIFVAAAGAIALSAYSPAGTGTWLRVNGSGNLILAAFGALSPITVQREYRLAPGHIVAFTDSLEFDWSEQRRRWQTGFFRRGDAYCCFRGRGTLWYQSHDPTRFARHQPIRQPA